MTYIPYLPAYKFASRPLDVQSLQQAHVQSRKHSVTATSRWQAAAGAFRTDVVKAVKASQDNAIARQITAWAGEGSSHLAKAFEGPQMPGTAARAGAVAFIGAGTIYGAAHVAPWVALTGLGVVAEASALIGLGARYAMAGIAAVGASVWGVVHGLRQAIAWDTRVTTLHLPFDDIIATMQPMYDDIFSVKAGQQWPPKWSTVGQDLEVHEQFALDCLRLPNAMLTQGELSGGVQLRVELTERLDEKEPQGDSPASREQVAANNLLRACDDDRGWAAHVSTVLNQSLGNVVFQMLKTNPILYQGGRSVAPCSPTGQTYNVTKRDGDTIEVSGEFIWSKGYNLMDADGNGMAGAGSTPLWFTYSLDVKRPANAAAPLQAKLTEANLGLGSAPKAEAERARAIGYPTPLTDGRSMPAYSL